jgi:hypothetical protein
LTCINLDWSLPSASNQTRDEQVGLSVDQLAVEDPTSSIGCHGGAVDVEDRGSRSIEHVCWRERRLGGGGGQQGSCQGERQHHAQGKAWTGRVGAQKLEGRTHEKTTTATNFGPPLRTGDEVNPYYGGRFSMGNFFTTVSHQGRFQNVRDDDHHFFTSCGWRPGRLRQSPPHGSTLPMPINLCIARASG